MGQASSLAGMAQQVALAIGVTIGGYALTAASLASGLPMDAAINFTFAFLTVGLISASSAWMMLRLARRRRRGDVGQGPAGRGSRRTQAAATTRHLIAPRHCWAGSHRHQCVS